MEAEERKRDMLVKEYEIEVEEVEKRRSNKVLWFLHGLLTSAKPL